MVNFKAITPRMRSASVNLHIQLTRAFMSWSYNNYIFSTIIAMLNSNRFYTIFISISLLPSSLVFVFALWMKAFDYCFCLWFIHFIFIYPGSFSSQPFDIHFVNIFYSHFLLLLLSIFSSFDCVVFYFVYVFSIFSSCLAFGHLTRAHCQCNTEHVRLECSQLDVVLEMLSFSSFHTASVMIDSSDAIFFLHTTYLPRLYLAWYLAESCLLSDTVILQVFLQLFFLLNFLQFSFLCVS